MLRIMLAVIGPYPTYRARLVSRPSSVSAFFKQGRWHQRDGSPDPPVARGPERPGCRGGGWPLPVLQVKPFKSVDTIGGHSNGENRHYSGRMTGG